MKGVKLYYNNEALKMMSEAIKMAEEETGIKNETIYISLDADDAPKDGGTLMIYPTEERFMISVFSRFGQLESKQQFENEIKRRSNALMKVVDYVYCNGIGSIEKEFGVENLIDDHLEVWKFKRKAMEVIKKAAAFTKTKGYVSPWINEAVEMIEAEGEFIFHRDYQNIYSWEKYGTQPALDEVYARKDGKGTLRDLNG